MDSTPSTDFGIDDYSTELSITQGISDYYLYVLAGIGIPANLLAIATILTINVLTPATFFVAVLSACDCLSLTFKLVFSKLGSFNLVLCKLEFLPIFFTIMAHWMLVFVCAERFISVFFPEKKAQLVTRRKSYISVGLTGAILFMALGSLFMTMRTQKGRNCGTFIQYSYFWEQFWLYGLSSSFAVFLPFLFISFFTVAIILGLRVSSTRRRSLLIESTTEQSSHDQSQSTNERQLEKTEMLERKITVMMTFTAVYFLVFSLPSCIFYCLKNPESMAGFINYYLFEQIQFLLLDSTHALNFFLYVLTFKGFRRHLVKLLTCKIVWKSYPTHVGNTQTSSLESESFELLNTCSIAVPLLSQGNSS